MTTLTEAQRATLLDRAVDAVRARLAITPDTDPHEVTRHSEIATMAVTDAVTRGEHLHTQIANLAGCTGLQVINLITDETARGEALAVERNAVKNYAALVDRAIREHAARAGSRHGEKTRIADRFGVTRATVDAWIEKAKAGEATI